MRAGSTERTSRAGKLNLMSRMCRSLSRTAVLPGGSGFRCLPASITRLSLAGRLTFALRIASRQHRVVDVERTVERMAEMWSISPNRPWPWCPVIRPRSEARFSIHLVVEPGGSMAVWWESVAQLRRLLEQLGAFRDVRAWRLIGGLLRPEVAHAGVDPQGALGPWRPSDHPPSQRRACARLARRIDAPHPPSLGA